MTLLVPEKEDTGSVIFARIGVVNNSNFIFLSETGFLFLSHQKNTYEQNHLHLHVGYKGSHRDNQENDWE